MKYWSNIGVYPATTSLVQGTAKIWGILSVTVSYHPRSIHCLQHKTLKGRKKEGFKLSSQLRNFRSAKARPLSLRSSVIKADVWFWWLVWLQACCCAWRRKREYGQDSVDNSRNGRGVGGRTGLSPLHVSDRGSRLADGPVLGLVLRRA